MMPLPEFQSFNYENINHPMKINTGSENMTIVTQKNILAPRALVPGRFASSGESFIT